MLVLDVLAFHLQLVELEFVVCLHKTYLIIYFNVV